MKKIILISFTFSFAFIAAIIAAQENTSTGTLKVLVEGFSNDKGSAMIALCDSKECYKKTDKPFMGVMASIKEGKAEWIISDLPYGAYTLSIVHDENANGKMDTGIFGIPKEQYGFSNNAWANFSQPKYEKALFEFNKAEMTIKITVRYWEKGEKK